jgi:hypothetical protein
MATSDAMMNYQKSTDYDFQPFFKAGDCVPLKWIHRKRGDMYNATLLKDDNEIVDDSDNDYAVLSSSSNGIAGTTYYQVSAQIQSVPSSS